VDVHDKLDEISSLVRKARAMPMSASCVVNRQQLLGLLDELRLLLPEELRHAEELLQERDAVVDQGRHRAGRIVDEAQSQRAELVSETAVMAKARHEAAELLRRANDEITQMRVDVDNYVDEKLANFEVVLTKTLGAVHRGREKLRGHQELAGRDDADDDLMPR
jgi:hypothetical protein